MIGAENNFFLSVTDCGVPYILKFKLLNQEHLFKLPIYLLNHTHGCEI